MKNILVIYHADCRDGFGGCWAAWKKFKHHATYLPQAHQHPLVPPPPLTIFKNKNIYLIDYVYHESFMKKLVQVAKKVTVIDHHKSAYSAAHLAHETFYDLKHSGATLAWMYFHPSKKIPQLLLHIEAQDLWRFRYPDTPAILATLDLHPSTFSSFNSFAHALEKLPQRKKIIQRGKTIIAAYHNLQQELTTHAVPVLFEGYHCLAVNSPLFRSQLGNHLAQQQPPFAIIWYASNNTIHVSLRAKKGFDVSVIAQRYGGGGHPEAASFRLRLTDPLPWKYLPHKNPSEKI